MPTYARIAVAKQKIAETIDRHTDIGHYVMVKQVRHETVPATPPLPSKFAASPMQIFSPTSAPLHSKKPLRASRVPTTAQSLAPMQQFEAILDVSLHDTLSTSRLTPTEQFEKVLNYELQTKTKAEMNRTARWYWL